MRDSGLVSTGPNLAKSTFGHGGRFRPSAAPAAPRRGCAQRAALTNACTSSLVMRPLGPVPFTCARSTPSSRAKRRTDGLACAFAKVGFVDRAGRRRPVPVPPARRAVAGACRDAAAAGARRSGRRRGLRGAGAACAAVRGSFAASMRQDRACPCETLSPTLTLSSLTTPAYGDGTSIVALSVSSVISESSACTLSPGFDQHLDDRHVLEVADVRHQDFLMSAHAFFPIVCC